VLTEWDEFRSYDWQRIYDNMQNHALYLMGEITLDRFPAGAIGFV
jgi:UDPglucose 6-dehydrogenase